MITAARETQTVGIECFSSVSCRFLTEASKLIDKIGLILADDPVSTNDLRQGLGKTRDLFGGPLRNCRNVLVESLKLRPHSPNLLRQLCQLFVRRHGRKKALAVKSYGFILNVHLNYIQLRRMKVLVGPSGTDQDGQPRSNRLCQLGGGAGEIDFACINIIHGFRIKNYSDVSTVRVLKELKSRNDLAVFRNHRRNAVRPKGSDCSALVAHRLDKRSMWPRFHLLQRHPAPCRSAAGVTIFDNAEGVGKVCQDTWITRIVPALVNPIQRPCFCFTPSNYRLSVRLADGNGNMELDFIARVDLRKSLSVGRIEHLDWESNLGSGRSLVRRPTEQPSQKLQTESPRKKSLRLDGKPGKMVASSCLLVGKLKTGRTRPQIQAKATRTFSNWKGSEL